MKEYSEYLESVLRELERLDFPLITHAACKVGVPEKVIAEYIQLMARALYLQRKTPQFTAYQIADIYEILLSHIMQSQDFPKE